MPRREIQHIVYGEEGTSNLTFGPLTIEELDRLGLIKKINILHSGPGDGTVIYETHIWEKA